MASTFPEIQHTSQLEVRFKNLRTETYLYMKHDNEGNVTFGTKALKTAEDPEVGFTLHLYDVAENSESKIALLVHQLTNSSLQMTPDKMLSVFQDNDLELPMDYRRADPRFFYFRRTDQGQDTCVLEGMNGVDYGHYLAADGTSVTLKKHEGASNYPEDITFYLDGTTYDLIMDNNLPS